MDHARIAVVGASLAGLSAARELRAQGYDGELVLVGDEPEPPYDRPPLSKRYLSGATDERGLDLLDAGEELGVAWRLGVAAVALDVPGRRVALADGGHVDYDGLVIATGASPRALPGTRLTGVHVLRTRADADALRAGLERATSVAIVGGGFIGSEIASTAVSLGKRVTIVEALPAPMERVLGEEVGLVLAGVHERHGVDMRLGTPVAGLRGDERVEGIELADGGFVPADVVVVAIGVVPNTGWLESSGLVLDNGVVCDETCAVAPGIVAAGDVARWPNPVFGESRRVEHWENAVKQGAHAARRLLADGDPDRYEPYAPVPWVWSDQYGTKLQFVGSTQRYDEVGLVDGSYADDRWAVLYRSGERVVAAFGIGRTRQVLGYRPLIAEGLRWEDALRATRAAT